MLMESQEIGDNYFAIGDSDQSSQGQQQTPLNPETVEKNKNYLKAMDNFQVSLGSLTHTHVQNVHKHLPLLPWLCTLITVAIIYLLWHVLSKI